MPHAHPVRIRGTGRCLPKEVVTNAYFTRYLDTSDEWITTRTGIRERRRLAPEETTSSMAAEAGRLAIADAGLDVEDIELVILCTATPDQPIPATACNLQERLGMKDTPVFDLGAACSGFLYGAIVATNLLQGRQFRHILVVGAEALTRVTDYEDRGTCILFGDAAGAAVMSWPDEPGPELLFSKLGADGTRIRDIWQPGGGSRLPASEATVAERLHYLRMKGREVYKFAVVKMRNLIDEALETTGLTPDDLRLVIPHQSNLRIIESVREKMKLPREKIVVNIDRYGNTSSASIPVALDEARREGQLTSGDLILCLSLGAGLTWAVGIWRL